MAERNGPMMAPMEPGFGPRGGYWLLFFCRGDACVAPTVITIHSFGNYDNPMHMIGHYLVRIQFYIFKMIGNGQPTFVAYFPKFI